MIILWFNSTIPQLEKTKILDLVITNIPELINISEVLSPAEAEIFTDHSVINFDLLVHPKRLPRINRGRYMTIGKEILQLLGLLSIP